MGLRSDRQFDRVGSTTAQRVSMAQQWEVAKPAGVCTVTGREIAEGEEFYTALFEEGESFRRADYSLDAWQGPPEGSFCHFKSRLPVKEKRRKLLVDNEVLLNFFQRLAGEAQESRVQFRFVLALILMRKRLLRYEGSNSEDGVETWDMLLTRDHSRHRVVNPRLTEEQIESVSGQLGTILHADMGEWSGEGETDDQPDNEGQADAVE